MSKAKKVLIITGNASFGDKIKSELDKSGYEVQLQKEGNEGLKAIYDILPHLVLVDIEVPGLNGYEILKRKNQEAMLSKIPVFLMSTEGVPINMREVSNGSVQEFIVSVHAEADEVVKKVNGHFGVVPQVAPAPAQSSGKRILWVEDDKLIGNILGKKLSNSGFDLVLAKNGEQAMQELAKQKPDAILIDLLLPGMNGFEILQQIRSNNSFKDVPVMVLSNLSKQSDVERTRILGAQKFMVKATASLDQIIAEVNNLIKNKV